MSNKNRYRKFILYVRNIVISAGCTKSSGEPNLSEFHQKYKEKGISYTTFRGLATDPVSPPYGTTLESLAKMLSKAARQNITPDMLIGMMTSPEFTEHDKDPDPDQIPGSEDLELSIAQDLVARLEAISIYTRQQVAPDLLAILSRDWRYLDATPPVQVSMALRWEMQRRGLGLEKFVKLIGWRGDWEVIRDLYDGVYPRRLLESGEINRLSKSIRLFNDEPLPSSVLIACNERFGDRPGPSPQSGSN